MKDGDVYLRIAVLKINYLLSSFYVSDQRMFYRHFVLLDTLLFISKKIP
jgi:hypothetical protein